MAGDATIYLRGVPRSTKDHFKAWCAKRGQNMTEVIVKFIKDTVAKDQRNDMEVNWLKKGG